jgi:very-short-patch-repair endonuclease/predicted transcriptional regulator of viral defense system
VQNITAGRLITVMAVESEQRVEFWRLVREQHGVVTRAQLVALGLTDHAIVHRVRHGRLHRVQRGVYAVGRPELTRYGRWMAAVLACGPGAALSHESAAALWRIRRDRGEPIEVSVLGRAPRIPDLAVHRREALRASDLTRCRSIPVTTPTCTLVDLAPRLGRGELERAISEADKLDLVDPEALRAAVAATAPRPGVRILRELLDRRSFRLTDSELERRFLELARAAGLPPPDTGARLNGYDVDFHWPELGLVVETDGLRYHRTPAQQARDRERDQVHAAAGLTPLRFTHAQVVHEPDRVRATLAAVARRLAPAA